MDTWHLLVIQCVIEWTLSPFIVELMFQFEAKQNVISWNLLHNIFSTSSHKIMIKVLICWFLFANLSFNYLISACVELQSPDHEAALVISYLVNVSSVIKKQNYVGMKGFLCPNNISIQFIQPNRFELCVHTKHSLIECSIESSMNNVSVPNR